MRERGAKVHADVGAAAAGTCVPAAVLRAAPFVCQLVYVSEA